MFNNTFYIIKPFIPRSLQIYLRRKLIQIRVQRYKNVWPILNGSELPPLDWKGWPDGKKFAVVLTHDVEHKKGYNSVIRLMQLEMELGFRSSFNFVPERDYNVNSELLNKLRDCGFEYGLHGLCHDGKLFSSKEVFLNRAQRINFYLKKWDAVGFRSPAMHHNLDWIGSLKIKYDLSTFDTDPFEPQPDGVGTIFPFWVENKDHEDGGYFELPYTLTQDFTAFILLQEKTINLWRYKADWIAKNGGMILLNVHPDYIDFNDKKKDSKEVFPVALYLDFLRYIKSQYANQYINILPGSLTEYLLKTRNA